MWVGGWGRGAPGKRNQSLHPGDAFWPICVLKHRPAVPAVPQGEGAAVNPPYSMEEMQRYLKYVRAIKPRITPAVRLTPLHAYLLWVPLGV